MPSLALCLLVVRQSPSGETAGSKQWPLPFGNHAGAAFGSRNLHYVGWCVRGLSPPIADTVSPQD